MLAPLSMQQPISPSLLELRHHSAHACARNCLALAACPRMRPQLSRTCCLPLHAPTCADTHIPCTHVCRTHVPQPTVAYAQATCCIHLAPCHSATRTCHPTCFVFAWCHPTKPWSIFPNRGVTNLPHLR
ncbi:hypothetical protein ACOSQ2_000018 [Xanthoceras sorbifolium]